MRLRTKILMCAGANIVLLALAVAVFVRLQFRQGVESILLAPGEERVRKLADQIAEDLPKTPVLEWDALLERYGHAHGVDLGMSLDQSAETVAGAIKRVPETVWHTLPVLRPAPQRLMLTPRVMNLRVMQQKLKSVRIEGEEYFLITNFNVNPPQPSRSVTFATEASPKQYWFGVGIPVRWPEQKLAQQGMLLIRSSSIIFKPLLFDSRPWLACLAAIGGITLLCWTPLIRGLTRSVRQITDAAGQIAEGHFDVKTGVRRSDEIGQLNDTIHRMAVQLSGFVTGQRRFLGDIAHELCAPIARTRVALGVLQERAEPTQKQYIETVDEEVEHMSGLVNELLQFSKAALSAKEPPAEPVAIAILIARVIEREAGQDARVRLVSGAELNVLAQPEGLFRAVSNVVRNSLRYTGGPVAISATVDGDNVLLTVADQGPGLPEEALDRVFTPFYRLDDSRSRESGGVGLGLAMVKSLVEASGGTVSCRNLKPGLEVMIRVRQA